MITQSAKSIRPLTLKMADNGTKSEDVHGQKWDRCLTDTGIKICELTNDQLNIVYCLYHYFVRCYCVNFKYALQHLNRLQ